VLEVSNLRATTMEATADMAKLKERIEFLSRPNKREQMLEETLEQLQAEIRQQESEMESLSAQVKSTSLQRENYGQLLDWGGMAMEDTVAQIVRRHDRRVQSVEAALLSKEGEVCELQKKLKGSEALQRMVQRCEQHLMAHEDRMTKNSNLMSRVLRAQRVSEVHSPGAVP
jgi:chromosome segregation ATPase